jgi:hypothetical protein
MAATFRPDNKFGKKETKLNVWSLTHHDSKAKRADIRERIYRSELDTPKTQKSIRTVALSNMVGEDLDEFQAGSPSGPEEWLFPSENLDSPLSKDNMLYRYMRPRLETVALGWVDYQNV